MTNKNQSTTQPTGYSQKFYEEIIKQENARDFIRKNTRPFYHFILYTGSKRCPTTLEYQSERFGTLKKAQAGYEKWLGIHGYEQKSNDWFPIFYYVKKGEGTAL